MTSSETLADGILPRPVVGRLPRYAAGKPPAPVEGLASYKLSSNENPLPPLPAVLEAIAGQRDFNRYPDPLSTRLRTALAGFLQVPAEDIVTGAGSRSLPRSPAKMRTASPTRSSMPGVPSRRTPSAWASRGHGVSRCP
jgi:histidinol-phosphate/aromatic aminotransferase/cobyric acid decarboxylase-like protein